LKTGEETHYRVKRLEKTEYGNVKMAENSTMAVSVSLVDPNFNFSANYLYDVINLV
jgi:hypothetical protein